MAHLQKPGQSELIVQKSLELLNELASGYSSLRTLLKMESTIHLLETHNDVSIKDRVLYYQILSKLLFAEDNCEREFIEFMNPFDLRLNQLASINTLEEFQQPKVQVNNPNNIYIVTDDLVSLHLKIYFLIFAASLHLYQVVKITSCFSIGFTRIICRS